MHNFGNSEFRFGDAKIATREMLLSSGALTYDPYALFSGYTDQGDIIWNGSGRLQLSGVSVFGPPRCGKLKDWLMMQTALGGSRHSRVIVDLRGECAYSTETIGLEGRYGIYWNPLALPDLPQDSLNPTEDLTIESLTLFEDLATTIPVLIQPSGAAQSKFFEETAQRYAQSLSLCTIERDGVLTLPALFDAVQALNAGGGRWKHQFEPLLKRSRFSVCHDFADEVERGYDGASSGFDGVCAELAKSVKCLSSPLLRASLSGDYSFSFQNLIDPNQLYSLYLILSGDFLEAWNPIVRLIFMAARRAKQRSPGAPKQIHYFEEASAFKRFELIPELYSRGAGDGIIPVSIWQNTAQTAVFGDNARLILGAGQRIFFPPNDETSAREISSMIGHETLSYDDEMQQAKNRHAYNRSLISILNGADMLESGLEAMHQAESSVRSTKIARLVRQPAEILRMPSDRMWQWIEGIPAPIYAKRRAFFDTSWMAGRYTGTPHFPPKDQVWIMTSRGREMRRVITARVPDSMAHYPQYAQSGCFKYVEGFKPW